MEIKTKSGKLRPKQREFKDSWRGGPVYIIRNIDEALKAADAIKAAVV